MERNGREIKAEKLQFIDCVYVYSAYMQRACVSLPLCPCGCTEKIQLTTDDSTHTHTASLRVYSVALNVNCICARKEKQKRKGKKQILSDRQTTITRCQQRQRVYARERAGWPQVAKKCAKAKSLKAHTHTHCASCNCISHSPLLRSARHGTLSLSDAHPLSQLKFQSIPKVTAYTCNNYIH